MAYITQNTKDTVPNSTAKTGTITTSGTTFTISASGEVKEGDWIYDATQEEVRLVTRVNRSGQTGKIDSAFSSDLSAESLVIVERDAAKVVTMSISANQGSDTEVEGETLPSGESLHYSTTDEEAREGIMFVRPRVVDGTAGAFQYSLQVKGVAY
jgi:hypothetical protein